MLEEGPQRIIVDDSIVEGIDQVCDTDLASQAFRPKMLA